MEVIVVLAIILVIVVIAIPVYRVMLQRKHKAIAFENIRKLGDGIAIYTGQNDGYLPNEDAPGADTWEVLAKPEAKEAWYNALPRAIGRKPAADYAAAPSQFYTDENILFLPGADYPSKKKMINPLFAVAFNTKLQRKDAGGTKVRTRMTDIRDPRRTVALLEQGLVNEKRTLEVQGKKDYDGSPKGSAKSFVGRYGGQGVLYFLDGHAEFVAAADLLTETGNFPFPQTEVVWTANPEDNPNKVETGTTQE